MDRSVFKLAVFKVAKQVVFGKNHPRIFCGANIGFSVSDINNHRVLGGIRQKVPGLAMGANLAVFILEGIIRDDTLSGKLQLIRVNFQFLDAVNL